MRRPRGRRASRSDNGGIKCIKHHMYMYQNSSHETYVTQSWKNHLQGTCIQPKRPGSTSIVITRLHSSKQASTAHLERHQQHPNPPPHNRDSHATQQHPQKHPPTLLTSLPQQPHRPISNPKPEKQHTGHWYSPWPQSLQKRSKQKQASQPRTREDVGSSAGLEPSGRAWMLFVLVGK